MTHEIVPVDSDPIADTADESAASLRSSVQKAGSAEHARALQKAPAQDHGTRGNAEHFVRLCMPGLGEEETPHWLPAFIKKLTHRRERRAGKQIPIE